MACEKEISRNLEMFVFELQLNIWLILVWREIEITGSLTLWNSIATPQSLLNLHNKE